MSTVTNTIAGRFGVYGGRYVPETLMAALEELEHAYAEAQADPVFHAELDLLLSDYCRPAHAAVLRQAPDRAAGRREDLPEARRPAAHRRAQNQQRLGQGLLARRMGKQRIIAETGAGQHGVATATVCALFGHGMRGLHGRGRHAAPGAQRLPHAPAGRGSPRRQRPAPRTLKDAINEAMRDWVTNVRTTLLHAGQRLWARIPIPTMVRDFHRVIGQEIKQQILEKEGRLPDRGVACVGGGSNAIGAFYEFIDEPNVRLIGVEAGGRGTALGEHAARFQGGSPGVLQGTYSYVLQDDAGQVSLTHSVSAGLDYASVGPEHAQLHDSGRAEYVSASDEEALEAAVRLARTEGIVPALESAHAVAEAIRLAPKLARMTYWW